MKPTASVSAAVLSLAALVIAVIALGKDAEPHAQNAKPAQAPEPHSAVLDTRLAALEARLEQYSIPPPSEPAENTDLEQRLASLESSLTRLQESFDGISLETASEDRDALFRTEDGYLKADEYFAANKYAIAGEGYLAFLEAHPHHPDAYDILKRARQAFRNAGYHDKAIWAQEELIKNTGVRRPEDLMALAGIQKDAGYFDDAINHAAEAAELSNEPQAALWNKMYEAWYRQLRDGEAAGLAAYREIETSITDAGYSDGKLGERVREKIAELER